MSERTARTPFPFLGCWSYRRCSAGGPTTSASCWNTSREVPLDSIYFHTHRRLSARAGLPARTPNDFATWAAIQVRDRVLGEKLGIIDPQDLSDLESLRTEVVSLIDDHLSQLGAVPRVIFGEPFYFMHPGARGPTGVKVRTLREFRDVLSTVDSSVVYLHVVEARGRKVAAARLRHLGRRAARAPGAGGGDGAFDPFPSEGGVRRRLVALCDAS